MLNMKPGMMPQMPGQGPNQRPQMPGMSATGPMGLAGPPKMPMAGMGLNTSGGNAGGMTPPRPIGGMPVAPGGQTNPGGPGGMGSFPPPMGGGLPPMMAGVGTQVGLGNDMFFGPQQRQPMGLPGKPRPMIGGGRGVLPPMNVNPLGGMTRRR